MRAARPERGSHQPGEYFYYNNWDFNALGGPGIFFSGIGVHGLLIIPELKLALVIRMDTDGDWTPPPPGTGTKLYSMITGSRITQ